MFNFTFCAKIRQPAKRIIFLRPKRVNAKTHQPVLILLVNLFHPWLVKPGLNGLLGGVYAIPRYFYGLLP